MFESTTRTTGKRCAIYSRVSTGKQEETGSSLRTQVERCRAYAAQHGYHVVEDLVIQETHTGAELWERPKLTVLRHAVRQRDVDVVVAYAIDRIARDPVHLGVIVSEADHAGVAVEFVSEPLDDTPEGQLIRFVRGYAAKVEREKIKERSLRGRLARVQSGKIHNSATELYGYRRDREAGVRLVHEPEATVVRRIFRGIGEQGLSIRGMATALNREGVPSPAAGKRTFAPESGRSPRWGHSSIHRILDEPAYKGEQFAWRRATRDGGKQWQLRDPTEWIRLPEGTTPAIVSPQLWQAAFDRRQSNRGDALRNEQRPYLLRGVVFCSVCGRRMHSSPERNSRVYRCSSRDTASGACGGKRVPAGLAEEWVWEQLERILNDPGIIVAEIQRRHEAGPDRVLDADREAMERHLTKLDRQQERLVRKFAEALDGDAFPWELVEREIERTEQERKTLRKNLADLAARIAAQEAIIVELESLDQYCARVRDNLILADFTVRRQAVEALVHRVEMNGTDPDSWVLHGMIPVPSEEGVLSTTY